MSKATNSRGGVLLVLALAALMPRLAAQTLPPATDGDLLLPPSLRAGAPVPSRRTDASPRGVKATGRGKAAAGERQASPLPAHRDLPSQHPVDVGVVMRGGSGTPRLYSPSGTTQAVQESGSAFGAGMRIGF